MNGFSRCSLLLASVGCVAFATVVDGEEPQPSVMQFYTVSASLVSYMPGDSLGTYREHGRSSAGTGGSVGIGVSFDGANHSVSSTPKQRDGKLLVEVEINIDKKDSSVSEIDLTDLKPETIDLGSGMDGRRYHVTFTPHIQTLDATAKSLTEEVELFSNWQFREAPVIVDDAIYVGRLGGGGDIANFEISDIGSLEISLREMEGWQPWGTLKDGIVTIIRPDDRTGIEILNAQNGPSNAPLTLPGGPYRVWVRWEEAMKSEEVWKFARANRETMINNGLDPNDVRVSYIDKQLARQPGPWIVNSGFHGRRLSRPVKK